MPDHLHWLLRSGASLSSAIARFKSFSTRCAWACGHSGRLWQRSSYDHALRRSESLADVIAYLVANPVRAGLAASIDEWRFVFVADPDHGRHGGRPLRR